MALFKFLHLLAILIWVGGMFFAFVVLRPTTEKTLDTQNFRLWAAVLPLFLNWVWVAIGVTLITGFYLIYLYGGIARVSHHIHAMLALGLLMMLIHGYSFFTDYVPFSLHVAKQRWKEAEMSLKRIHKWVAVNLVLGLLIVGVVFTGITRS